MAQYDLAALVVELETVSACEVTPDLGGAAHALALGLVSARNPSLAERLHAGAPADHAAADGDGLDDETDSQRSGSRVQGGLRPFSAAIFTPAPPGRGPLRLRQGEKLLLRVTSQDPAVSDVLTELDASDLPPEIGVESIALRVHRVTTAPDEHALAGRDSITALTQRHLLSAQIPHPLIGMRFLTPTRFHSRGRNLPFPLPELVFGSLLDRWNNVSPVALPSEARAFAEQHLSIAGYRLSSRRVSAAGGRFVGFTGECRYETSKPDPYWLRVIDLLATFAFYSGIGAKTSMGFGQAAAAGRAAPASTMPRARPASQPGADGTNS